MPGRPPPPHSEPELIERAMAIAGMSIGDLATQYDVPIP
ncbi:MAG: DNA mismatch repair protein MutH, partial [Gammaproteobacteria bacterium]